MTMDAGAQGFIAAVCKATFSCLKATLVVKKDVSCC